MTAWLSAVEELEAYEGIRRGDADAFHAVAEPLQPTLRRLAGLYLDEPADADVVVLRTWEAALRGLHMFTWNTPLATWVARITVAFGRTKGAAARPAVPPPPPLPRPAADEVPGPADWSDLPWSARWQDAGVTLADALAALPLAQLEVVHGRDIERWPPQRVCDVFGLTRTTYQRRIRGARTALHGALAPLVDDVGRDHHRGAQILAVTGWLNQRLHLSPEPVDPRAMALFERWATRPRGWTRMRQVLAPVRLADIAR